MQTAARPGTQQGAGPKAVGCYKCGQTGHWARDCTAPQSQWINRQPPPGGWQQAGRTPGSGAGAVAGGSGARPTPATAAAPATGNPTADEFVDLAPAAEAAAQQQDTGVLARKEKRKRPKITMELLQGSKGLPDVLVNFPQAFRRQFKGRGHEASDLRRLLEMYKRWQDRLFPHGDFDSFILGVERLSGTMVLKHHMRELRLRKMQEVQDIVDPPHVHLDEDTAAAAGQQQRGGAGGAAPAGHAAAGVAGAELDADLELELVEEEEDHPELDDELLDMLEEPAGGAAGGAAAGDGARAAEDWEMELVDEEEEEAQAAVQAAAAGAAGAGGAEAAGGQQGQPAGVAMDEYELMELVEEEETEQAGGAAAAGVDSAATAGAVGEAAPQGAQQAAGAAGAAQGGGEQGQERAQEQGQEGDREEGEGGDVELDGDDDEELLRLAMEGSSQLPTQATVGGPAGAAAAAAGPSQALSQISLQPSPDLGAAGEGKGGDAELAGAVPAQQCTEEEEEQVWELGSGPAVVEPSPQLGFVSDTAEQVALSAFETQPAPGVPGGGGDASQEL